MEEEKTKFEYKPRHIRMSDKNWERLKERRKKSGKSWNKFIEELLAKKFKNNEDNKV